MWYIPGDLLHRSLKLYDIVTDSVNQITIVGGGDAGLMTGLILRARNTDLDITIIDDFDEIPADVGKSTINHILSTFHDFLDIDRTRFVKEVKPIWKATINFEDWCENDSFHFPFDGFTLMQNPGKQNFKTLYYRYNTKDYHTPGIEIAEEKKSPFIDLNQVSLDQLGLRTSNATKIKSTYKNDVTSYDHVAYHLSTNRLNKFLRKLCEERSIQLVNDDINHVDVQRNKIQSISSGEEHYTSDLFIDASGFNRVLMSNLDNTFREFDFLLDSALVAKTDISLSKIEPATVIESGKHGWFWQIDTIDGRDLGYVYSSDHVSEQEAKREFIREKGELSLDKDISNYEFSSGVYEKAWVNNCITVGNALGFVEPLHSTALTVNAMLTEKLSETLLDHHHINHQGLRDIYNEFSDSIWNNVSKFIKLHYLCSNEDTIFWNDMRKSIGQDHLDDVIQNYNKNGFASHHEFRDLKDPSLRIFNQYHIYLVLRHLEVESEFYEELDMSIPKKIKTRVNIHNKKIEEIVDNFLTHEEVYSDGIFGCDNTDP